MAKLMKRWLSTLLALAISASAVAGITPFSLGLVHGNQTNGANPLNLPLLTKTQLASMFTYLGSFTLPMSGFSGVVYGGGGISTYNNSMYITSLVYQPNGSGQYVGVASFPLPTLSGTPDYTGGNASVSSSSIVGPNGPGVMAPASYTLMTAPSSGAVSATFTTLPTGLTANAGWYIQFSDNEYELITGLSGNTVSWATGLTSSVTTAVTVYEWNPIQLWSSGVGSANNQITGTQVYNGKLYVTGGGTFDANCNQQYGWLAITDPTTIGPNWGTVNTVAGTNTFEGSSPENSRYMAGPLNTVPSIWQPYVGTAVEMGGAGLSINECFQAQGPTFVEFDPANASQSGAAVPVTIGLAYYYNTMHPEWSLAGRALSGPYPTCTQTASCSPSATGYPATLSTAAKAGDTTETLSLPSGNVVVTANLTAGSNAMVVTAITSGTISDSGIGYTLTDSAGVLTGSQAEPTYPSYDYSPGTALGTGTYQIFNQPTTSATSDTVTMTPNGYASGAADAYTVTFSDGESRTATISGSTITFTPATPLTCSPSCTTAITLAAMGDKYYATGYQEPHATGFIVPGTRTLLELETELSGVDSPRGLAPICDSGDSSQFWNPLAPDTNPYEDWLWLMYDMNTIYTQTQGTTPYVASPYDSAAFYDESNYRIASGTAKGCLPKNPIGWAYFDYSTDIWYIAAGTYPTIVYEYRLTPP